MRILLATLVALTVILPATAAAQDPLVTTGPAQPVGTTTATLTGTVDPNGVPTTYHWEYGTSATGTRLSTPTQSAGSAPGPQAVQATVSGLTPATTYFVRLVANDQQGADTTFTTLASSGNPAAPAISRLSATAKTASSASLTARIDPNRAATTYHVEWGTTTRLGTSTPDVTLAAGDGNVTVSVPVAGLPTHTKISWRVVASNAAGLRRSGIASFTTLRAPSGISLRVFPDVTQWNGSVSVSGSIGGAGVNGMTVTLEQATFPYTAGFQPVATARAGATGDFRFPNRPVQAATRFRAVTTTPMPLASAAVEALVRTRVGIRRARKSRRAVVLAGRVNPGLPDGRATLQRRTRAGGWVLVRRRALRTPASDTSTYRFTVRRKRRTVGYRVKVAANDRGAHLGGTSRTLVVARQRRG